MRTLKVSGDLHKTSYRLLVIIIILQFYSNILFSGNVLGTGMTKCPFISKIVLAEYQRLSSLRVMDFVARGQIRKFGD